MEKSKLQTAYYFPESNAENKTEKLTVTTLQDSTDEFATTQSVHCRAGKDIEVARIGYWL